MWRKLKKNFRQWYIVALTAPTVAGTVILLSLTGTFQLLEWATLDQFFRFRPQQSSDSRIVIVSIDESDIVNLGQWPMTDTDLAQLLTKIQQQQPRVIGLDLVRDLPQEPGYETLIELFQSTPNLIGIEKTAGDTVAPPPVLAERDQVGSADLLTDSDNKIRRGLLSITQNNNLKFSFGVKLALQYLQSEGIQLKVIDADKDIYGLGQSVFKRLNSNDGGYVRVNTAGYQILLNYRSSKESFAIVSMTEVLENQIPLDLMEDRIVLIGAIAPSLQDILDTPYGQMSGVAIHAHLTSQLISAALDGRSPIQTLPDSLEWLGVLFWSTCSSILGVNFLRQRGLILFSIPTLAGVVVVISYGTFLLGWWIPIIPSGLAIFVSGFLSTVYSLWENLKLSYRKLENYAQTLEEKVEKRTEQLNLYIEQLRVSEEQFISIFRSTPNPITITSRQTGEHLLVNETFCKLTGYQPEEVIGRTALELNLWCNLNARDKMFKILDAEGKVKNYEGDFRIKSGQVRTALFSAEIIDFAGEECLLSLSNDITERKQAEEALHLEQEKSEQLLLNILPEVIVERLKQNQNTLAKHFEEVTIAEDFEEVTILFADIVGFTPLSTRLDPIKLVSLLNKIFSIFDDLTEEFGLEKIKTIGDAYMVAAGLPTPRKDHAEVIADMALVMQGVMDQVAFEENATLQLRIGINSGKVIAGVIGLKKFLYDLWGDSVNIASRMESSGQPGKIQVTEATYEKLKDQYAFEERGMIDVKGKGKMKTYFLLQYLGQRRKPYLTQREFEIGEITIDSRNNRIQLPKKARGGEEEEDGD